jgi:hypothetical protein
VRYSARLTGHRSLVGWLIAGYTIIPLAVGSQPNLQLTATSEPVRGIFRFSSTNWSTLAGDGFNWVTDGGANTNNYAGQRAAGLAGMVYLDAYNNSSCAQTMTDAQITRVVRTNVSGGNAGAVYQVGDEPTTNGCAANPTYTHMTAVIHAADRTAKSWVADDQFNDPSTSNWPAGLPMMGSVDILGFDIYPCQAGPCQFKMIDLAIERIQSVGLKNWEFIIQDFGPCQSWRAPTAAEVTQQFQHWQGAGALGYWVYTYDTDPTPCAGNVAGSGELRLINSLGVNAPAPTTSPVTKSSPKGSSTPSPRGSPRPSASPSAATGSPGNAVSPTGGLRPRAVSGTFDSPELWPLMVMGAGVLIALAGVALNRRRRVK